MPWDDFSDITNKAYDLFWNAAVGIAAETIGGYANAWTGSDEVGDFVTQGIQNLAGNGNADYFGIPGIPGGGFGAIMPGGGPSDQIVPYPAPGTQIFNPNWNNGNDTITGSPGGIPAAPGTQPFNPNWSYGTGTEQETKESQQHRELNRSTQTGHTERQHRERQHRERHILTDLETNPSSEDIQITVLTAQVLARTHRTHRLKQNHHVGNQIAHATNPHKINQCKT